MIRKLLLALGTVALVISAQAASISYSFKNISGNDAVNVATAGQYHMAVSDEGVPANQVTFTFTNSGPAASYIEGVYFDDGELLGIASFSYSGQVKFSVAPSPEELPSGGSINFNTGYNGSNPEYFSADSDPGAKWGVNIGESLTVTYNLINGSTYADVINALETADFNRDVAGQLRVGIKVQGYANGGSETFVNVPNNPPTNVPDGGATVMLLGGAFAGLGAFRRYFVKA